MGLSKTLLKSLKPCTAIMKKDFGKTKKNYRRKTHNSTALKNWTIFTGYQWNPTTRPDLILHTTSPVKTNRLENCNKFPLHGIYENSKNESRNFLFPLPTTEPQTTYDFKIYISGK